MWLKFTGCDRGSFSGGLLPFLPVCCRDCAERVSAVRTTDVMVNVTRFDDDLWFLHFGYKVTFPHCIFVSFDVANHMMGR